VKKDGYRSYHGRMSGGKRAAIVIMVAILVLAAVYLVSQHFVVYDDAGGVHIHWPFAHDDEKPAEDPLPEHDDLEIIIGTKDDPADGSSGEGVLAPVVGYYLKGDLALADNEGKAFVAEMKDGQGRLRYPSGLITAKDAGAVEGDEADAAALELMLNAYGVASISAVRDNYYPLINTEKAGLCREGYYPWRAFDACYYLDPVKAEARDYICSVAEECVSLGFDEVLLSDIGYPAEGEGRLYRILYPEDPRTAVAGMLTAVGGAVRRDGAVFSVELTAQTVLEGFDEVRYVYLEDVLAAADRVYVKTTEAEAIAIAKVIGEAADFVAIFTEEPSADYTGNYVIMK